MENEQITTLEQALTLVEVASIEAIGNAMRQNSVTALALWVAWWQYSRVPTQANADTLIDKAELWRQFPDTAQKGA